jgi:hypothetical protein
MSRSIFVLCLVSFSLIVACGKDPVTPPRKSGPTCVAASDSIVGWWPLDHLGSTAEELVDGNQGDYVSSPAEAEGKVGGAIRFDGVDDLIVIPDPGANWVYDITGSITLETWIKRDSDQTGQQVFVGKGSAYFLGCRSGRIFSLIPYAFDFVGATPLPVGEWSHVAVTYDLPGLVAKIYLNGEVDGAVTTSGRNVPISNEPIYIGGLSGQQYFDGSMDEVSVYKTALSTSEVREIYSRGSRGKCK